MIPISITIECAKGEIQNAIKNIKNNYTLPPCIIEGIISSALAEIRSETKVELVNAADAMMREKNEELEKAKAAAKKTLKTEPEEQETPEEYEKEEVRDDERIDKDDNENKP